MTWAIRWGPTRSWISNPAGISARPGNGIIRTHPFPLGTVPYLRGAGEGRRKSRGPHVEVFRDTLVEQAAQGVDYFTIHAAAPAYVPLTAGRVAGIVSRGGSILAKWCLAITWRTSST